MKVEHEQPKESAGLTGKLRERYGTFVESVPDAMVFVDGSGRIVIANSQMEHLFGYTPEELTGTELHLLIPERFRPRHGEDVSRFFRAPRIRHMGSGLKITGLRKDGSEFRADISLSPLVLDGEVLVIAAIRDITDQVRAEEQIEFDYRIQRMVSEVLSIALEPVPFDEQLDLILSLVLSALEPSRNAKGMIYVLDEGSGSMILRAHRGFSAEERRPEIRVPDEIKPAEWKKLTCEVTRTGGRDAPYELLYRDGSSRAHLCIPILVGGKISGLIDIFAAEWPEPVSREEVFVRAISQTLAVVIRRYRAVSEKNFLLEKLAQSEKLAALGRLSANVAHEMRNPLTVVGGFARRLKESVDAGSREREYADFIVSEVSRLEEILKDIFAFARTSTPQLKAQPIHEIADTVLKANEDLCSEHSISVRKDYGYSGDVAVDRNRVMEVITNIVINAIDAMPDGGTLTVATSREEVEGKAYVTIRISDTGEGIPPERLNRVFEPFFTTRLSQKGIGLGLSISKKIMEDHGGFITVGSEPGKGTTFTLYFPGPQ